MHFNIADLIESLADVVPDRDCLVCGDRRLTFGQFEERANRLAHWFSSQGIGHNDHVGIYLYNSLEYVEALFALLKIRAVPININYRYVTHELAYLFDNADLKGLVYGKEFAETASAAAADVSTLGVFLYVDDDSGVSPVGTEFEAAMASGSTERDFEERSNDDLYVIYTGGTTGMPRGVMWRQEDLFFAALQGGNPGDDAYEKPEDLAAAVASNKRFPMIMHPAAPLIHGAAQLTNWICLFTGGRVVYVPGRSFKPENTLRAVQDEGAYVVNMVGDAMCRPFAEELEAHPEKYDVSSLVTISSAGAILSDTVKDKLEALLPDCMILNSFGASEMGHAGSAFYDGVNPKPRFFLKDDTAILDEEGNPVPDGTPGRLARTGNIPLGYYGDPEKTARTFPTYNGVRYVVPGDYGVVEEDGFVTLLGRGSGCINTGGEKVYPEEVEEALKGHPEVFDAVVVGVDDERWMQRVVAIVQAREGTDPSFASMDAHCRARVAGYKAPRAIHVVDTITRHPSGKPDYRWAKETATRLESPA